MECAVCEIRINRRYDDYIECSECSSSSHIKCVELKIDDYHKMVKDKSVKDWSCKGCSTDITPVSKDDSERILSQNETGCGADIVHGSGAKEDIAGSPLEVTINLLLEKVDTLMHTAVKTCCCESLISNLRNENLELRKAIESQSLLIESLRVDIRACIAPSQGVCGAVNNINTRQSQKMSAPEAVHILGEELRGHRQVRQRNVEAEASTVRNSGAKPGNKVADTSPNKATPATTTSLRRCENAENDDAVLPNIQPWTRVANKSKRGRNNMRDPIVGELQTDKAMLKAVPRRTCLHVTRLHPQTTSEDVTESLKEDLPGVVCEQLRSRFPESYASFKVTIDQDDLNKAMTPLLWPKGTFVRRFFQRRRREIAET